MNCATCFLLSWFCFNCLVTKCSFLLDFFNKIFSRGGKCSEIQHLGLPYFIDPIFRSSNLYDSHSTFSKPPLGHAQLMDIFIKSDMKCHDPMLQIRNILVFDNLWILICLKWSTLVWDFAVNFPQSLCSLVSANLYYFCI